LPAKQLVGPSPATSALLARALPADIARSN
jgi:hypothetical protein